MNPASFRIHALVPTELDAFARLHGECFVEAWDADALATLMAMPGAFALLARDEDSGALLGFVMIRGVGDEAEIVTLGVDPRRRRRGLGRALLAAGLNEAATLGSARLFLEVAADNSAALALYRAAGFTEIGRRANYYHRPDGRMTALVMARAVAMADTIEGGAARQIKN
ncbi:MAG TPA: GNAT family N-acetyltransferase [Dongiaceae bacterium]|jgi:ribosomal-protein-alanine N-acetyltransferase